MKCQLLHQVFFFFLPIFAKGSFTEIRQATVPAAPGVSAWAVSMPPSDDSLSGIIGGSGAFESMGGTYTEILKPNPKGDGTFVGQIALEKVIR